MNWVDIIVVILLILSVLSGMKEGAVKALSSLVALFIAAFLAGLSYGVVASWLSFLPGVDWENFLGFFITSGVFSVILLLIFFIPRKVISAVWKKGLISRVLGGAFSLAGSIIGFAVFTLVVLTYPVFDWLARWVGGSGILSALADFFSFILPATFSAALL